MLRPASRQMSISRVAPFASVEPQARKNSVPPPNVPVPRLSTGTLNPDPPSSLYSMAAAFLRCEVEPGGWPGRWRDVGSNDPSPDDLGFFQNTPSPVRPARA